MVRTSRSSALFLVPSWLTIVNPLLVSTRLFPPEDLLPSIPVCRQDNVQRLCNPSPPSHGRRIRWQSMRIRTVGDDLGVLIGQQVPGEFLDSFGGNVQRSENRGFAEAPGRDLLSFWAAIARKRDEFSR